MAEFTANIRRVGQLYAVDVPAALMSKLGSGRAKCVLARYAGEEHESTVTPGGAGRGRLFLRVELLRAAGFEVGAKIKIGLKPHTRTQVEYPEDLRRALQFRPAAAAALGRASPSNKRLAVALLEQCRTPETRARRLEKLIERLAENTAERATKL